MGICLRYRNNKGLLLMAGVILLKVSEVERIDRLPEAKIKWTPRITK